MCLARKYYAFDENDEWINAKQAPDNKKYSDLLGRRMCRKVLPGRKREIADNHYFSYWRLGAGKHGHHPGTSPTHRILQELIFDLNYLRCSINGAIFWARLGPSTSIERTTRKDLRVLRGTRRHDLFADEIPASASEMLIGNALLIEIGITSQVESYQRLTDILKLGFFALELLPERNLDLERDEEKLRRDLISKLFAGAIPARWILSPDGARARYQPTTEIRRLIIAKIDTLSTLHAQHASKLQQSQKALEDATADGHLNKESIEARKALAAVIEQGKVIERRRALRQPSWEGLIDYLVPRFGVHARVTTKKRRLQLVKSDVIDTVGAPGRSGIIGWLTRADDALRRYRTAYSGSLRRRQLNLDKASDAFNDTEISLRLATQSTELVDELECHSITELIIGPRWDPVQTVHLEHEKLKASVAAAGPLASETRLEPSRGAFGSDQPG